MCIIVERKKESMQVNSTMLAGQRETTCLEKKERADTGIEFFFLYFLFILTCFVHWFCLHRVAYGARAFFGTTNVQLPVFNSSRLPLTSPDVGGRDYIRFRRFYTCAEDLGPPFFFLSFLINVVIHPWMIDSQLSKPKSLRGQLPAPVDTMSALFSLLFVLLSLSSTRN